VKVLVIGSGGREHALVWKLRQSAEVQQIYCAPGNAGIGEMAELAPIGAEEIGGLRRFVEEKGIDLTIVGPELPLTLGIVDEFCARGLRIFGPCRAAAQLEGSKVFAKRLLEENSVPTARFASFTDAPSAWRYLRDVAPPLVIKADGLAGGKGVVVCGSRDEAERAVDEAMVRKVFGAAGERVIVEEFLAGEEASFMILADGKNYVPLATSQDHKRVFDGDRGPNTGGMGAYSPAPLVDAVMHGRIIREIVEPVLRGLSKQGISYRGVLYVGLMITDEGPKVLEFNARFGDPECQPIMMRLKSDLLTLLEATIDGELDRVKVEWDPGASVCVVLCSGGYPAQIEPGKEIHGLDRLRNWRKGFVFHAGTAKSGDRWLTSGGRVLGVTARGADIAEATGEAYRAVGEITWEGMHYRKDIARRAINLS
jgi:phosphoribosylamine--glycine ligase